MAREKNDGRGRMGGRQKGTPNRLTSTAKEWLSQLIDNNREQIEEDIKSLEPKERLQILERLMQYVIPKQQAVSANINYDRLTDEQLDYIITELSSSVEQGETDNED